jgi:hypothetical protein
MNQIARIPFSQRIRNPGSRTIRNGDGNKGPSSVRSPSSVWYIVDMGARSQVQFEVFPNAAPFPFIGEKFKPNIAGSIGIASAFLIY